MLLQKAVCKIRHWNEKISTCFLRSSISVGPHKIYIGSDIGMRKNYLTPSYFQSFQSICDRYLKSGDIVLDVGAHVGVTGSMMWQKIQPNGALYAFEPNPSVFEILNKNFETNRIRNTETFNVLCGSEERDLSFFVNPAHTGLSSISSENLFSPEDIVEIKTHMVRLSEFCKERKIFPNFIKIDTQGAELEVLKGLGETFRDQLGRSLNSSDRPLTIYIEFWPAGIERISKIHPAEFLKFCDENNLKIQWSEHFNHLIENGKMTEETRIKYVKQISDLTSQYTNLVLQLSR